MKLRRLASGCVVVALSFGAGGMAYSQSTANVATVASSPSSAHALSSGAQAESPATLVQEFAQIAGVAARSQASYAKGAQFPVLHEEPGGQPVHMYNLPQEALAAPRNALVGDRAGAMPSPIGAEQAATSGKKSYVCGTPGDWCSSNWSGREDWGQSFDGVSADWTVPLTTPAPDPNDPGTYSPQDMSTWIGIDGDATFDDNVVPSLIQIGTDSPSGGDTTYGYEAWYELLPGFEIPLFLVNPGDHIRAVIAETSPNVWDMAIEDVTRGMAWSDAGVSYDSPGHSAEWIQEATTLCSGDTLASCGVSQVQDFGSVTFTGMGYTTTAGGSTVAAGDDTSSRSLFTVDGNGDVLDYPTLSNSSSMTVTEGPPGAIPGAFNAMAVDPTTGDVFVSSTNTVTEVNPIGIDIGSATVDGAAGIAVVGGSVYVASSSGVVELDASNLDAVTMLGGVSPKDDLVYADGDLWTTSGTSLVQVRLPLTGTASTFDNEVEGSGLVADPNDTDVLFSYNPLANPVTINEVNVSGAPATTLTESESSNNISDVQDAVVSPDGSTLVAAAGAPGNEFVGLSTTDLLSEPSPYPAASYPTAVAMTSGQGGIFAGAVNDNSLGAATVFVYKLGSPSDLMIEANFASTVPYASPGVPAATVPPGGLAFSPDGSDLFAVTQASSTGAYTLNVVQVTTPSPSAGLGDISGSVTNGAGGLANVCVFAFGTTSTAGYSTETETDGDYYLDDLLPGHYKVEFDPTCENTQSSGFATQFYNDEPDYGLASAVTVTDGIVTPDINTTLVGGSSISGTVSDAAGDIGGDGACVYAYSTTGYLVGSGETLFDGAYSIDNLPVDNYVLFFDPTCGGDITEPAPDAAEFSGGADTFATAGSVSITAVGQDVDNSGTSPDLATQATISGLVTASGAGVGNDGGICVDAFPVTDENAALVQTETHPDGSYTIGNLPAGDYVVRFDPTCNGTALSDYAAQDYDDVESFGTATVTEVPSGGAASLDPASLDEIVPGPTITPTSTLTSGAVGTGYFFALGATGGTAAWTWTVSGLPEGLQAYSGLPIGICPTCGGGIIYGTPTQGGDFTVTLTVTDSSTPPISATTELTLDITGGGGGGGGGGGFPGLPTTTTTTPSTATTTGSTPPPTPAPTTTVPTLPIGSVTGTVGVTGASISNQSGGAHAHVSVPAGALPAGTKVSISPVTGTGALTSQLPAGQSYVVGFSVSWLAPNGTSPAAKPPLNMTIVDPGIKAGDTIYLLTPHGLEAVGVAAANGQATISFTTDPEFIVVAVPRLSGVGAAASLKGPAIDVKLSCGPAIKCSGSGTLTAETGKGASVHSVVLARGNFTIAAGKAKTISFTRTSRGAKFLKSHKDFTTQLDVSLVGGKKSAHQVHVP